MLIVVAIIAILIAVSIPLVSSALERARVATDAANERACKAEALICFLNGRIDESKAVNSFGDKKAYAYDAAAGKLIEEAPKTFYGKCTDAHGTTSTGGHKDGYLAVSVTSEGEVFMKWMKKTETVPTTVLTATDNGTLHGINVDAS